MVGAVWRGRRFVIDRNRLVRRAIELGVRGNLDVKLTRYRNDRGTVACLRPLAAGGWRLVLDTTLDAEDASISLYHELAHALQAQRLGGWDALIEQRTKELREARLTGRDRRRFFNARARERMPLEWEADTLAYQWHDELPLAVRRGE